MLGSAPHFCAFTHENLAAAEPCYFVQCDSFRRAWHSTCKQTLFCCLVVVLLSSLLFIFSRGSLAYYTASHLALLAFTHTLAVAHGRAAAETTSEAGPKAASHLASHFEFRAFTHKPGHGSVTARPRPTAVCKRGLSWKSPYHSSNYCWNGSIIF